MTANRPHGGVKEKADVADGQRRDLTDFLVAEVALELQVDDLALVLRKFPEDAPDPRQRLLRVVPLLEVVAHRDVVVVEGGHTHGLSARVLRQVPTDREQPRPETPVELRRIFPAQAQERLLHDVPGRLQVASQPLRVADERPLVKRQRIGHPVGVRRPAHSVSREITDHATLS